MFSHLPRRHRAIIRSTLSVAWLLTAAGGGAAILWTPTTIESELGTRLTHFWGAVAAVASIVAFLGVVLDHYRMEWAASWFASGGISLYAGVLWWLVSTGSETRLTQALLITALLVHTLNRAVSCAAHAARLREHSAETGETGVVA